MCLDLLGSFCLWSTCTINRSSKIISCLDYFFSFLYHYSTLSATFCLAHAQGNILSNKRQIQILASCMIEGLQTSLFYLLLSALFL